MITAAAATHSFHHASVELAISYSVRVGADFSSCCKRVANEAWHHQAQAFISVSFRVALEHTVGCGLVTLVQI